MKRILVTAAEPEEIVCAEQAHRLHEHNIDGKIEECKFPDEEIQAGLYTKEEVRKLLKEECFSARTQTACYLWAKE